MGKNITVLGAGIVGICTSLSLAERGAQVTLIDRGAPGQETSYGNAGVISPAAVVPNAEPGLWRDLPRLLLSPNSPLSVTARAWPSMIPWGLRFLAQGRRSKITDVSRAMSLLCGPSIDLYRKHLSGTGHENLLRDSLYIHAYRSADAASLSTLAAQLKQASGAKLSVVSSAELHRLEPALSPDFKSALIMHDQARALSPGRIGTVLAEKAQAMGVQIRQFDVRRLSRSDAGWQLSGHAGEHTAETLVVTLGAWSPTLLKQLGIHLPMMTERGYHAEFPTPGITLNNSVMDTDYALAASSMENGLRVAGQAEFSTLDAPASKNRANRMQRLARAMLPDVQGTPNSWMGRRPTFPDSLPVLDEISPDLWGAFGHSHWGLMQAPQTGEVMADMILGKRPNIDLSAFSAKRF